MKVCFVSNGIPTEKAPLLGIFEFDQARELAKLGNQVTYLAIDMRSFRKRRKWGISKYERDGVVIFEYNIPIGGMPLPVLSFVGKQMAQRVYKKAYMKSQPDLLHAHFILMGDIAAYVSKKNDVPLVITEHSSLMNADQIKGNVLACAKRSYGSAKRVIAVSSALAHKIDEYTGIQSIIIPNLLSIQCFFESEYRQHRGYGFVATCKLTEHKRPEQLIKAFISVAKENEDIFLGMIGDGELLERLQHIAAKSTVGDRISFYGLQNRESIATIYGKYDCFVLPSVRETFGVSYIEAMAAGLPVIATRCGGPEDFVSDYNGVLIPVDDDAALKKSLTYMYENANKFDRERIRKEIKNKYSGDRIANEIQAVYRDVLEGRGE